MEEEGARVHARLRVCVHAFLELCVHVLEAVSVLHSRRKGLSTLSRSLALSLFSLSSHSISVSPFASSPRVSRVLFSHRVSPLSSCAESKVVFRACHRRCRGWHAPGPAAADSLHAK